MSELTCLGGESDCPCSTEADGTCVVFVQPATFAAVAEALGVGEVRG